MAARKPGKVAAPVKQKLRKNHGPKRKMFHCWDQTTRLAFAKAGLLDKYHNYESFVQCCQSKGVKKDIDAMWMNFIGLPLEEKRNFFKNLSK